MSITLRSGNRRVNSVTFDTFKCALGAFGVCLVLSRMPGGRRVR